MGLASLKGKQVLVTGAASGIGLECARSFAKRGANLILTDISAEALDSARREVEALAVACLAYPCNVADEAAVQALAGTVHAQIGAVDVLVNNAGIGYLGGFVETSTAAWRRILDVNVMGVVHMTQAFLPAMRAAGGTRRIINVASGAGFAPVVNMSAYAASKHAVVGLSEVLAMELHDSDIGVLIVAPGVINTNIANSPSAPDISDNQRQKLQAFYSAKGCTPDVVAEGIVKAVAGKKAVLEIGPFAKLSCTLMRLSRRLARRIAIKSAKDIGYLARGV